MTASSGVLKRFDMVGSVCLSVSFSVSLSLCWRKKKEGRKRRGREEGKEACTQDFRALYHMQCAGRSSFLLSYYSIIIILLLLFIVVISFLFFFSFPPLGRRITHRPDRAQKATGLPVAMCRRQDAVGAVPCSRVQKSPRYAEWR